VVCEPTPRSFFPFPTVVTNLYHNYVVLTPFCLSLARSFLVGFFWLQLLLESLLRAAHVFSFSGPPLDKAGLATTPFSPFPLLPNPTIPLLSEDFDVVVPPYSVTSHAHLCNLAILVHQRYHPGTCCQPPCFLVFPVPVFSPRADAEMNL